MPSVALPPGTLFTCHVTAVLVVSVTVAWKDCEPSPACRLTVLGETDTATGDVIERVFGQAAEPAFAGAVVVAPVGDTMIVAESERLGIESSNTVNVTVKEPLLGTVTEVLAELALETG